MWYSINDEKNHVKLTTQNSPKFHISNNLTL